MGNFCVSLEFFNAFFLDLYINEYVKIRINY